MNAPPTPALENETTAASRRLRLLGEQADAVRAELSQLRAELAAAKHEFGRLSTDQLAETSEMLVVAAAHADNVAQSAVSSLDELNLYSQLDELTGLPTRSLLLDRIETSISTAQRRGTRFGVVFLDLDGFKQINDSFGHGAGDQVLQVATQRLQSVVRDSDTVSRHGGDEFILLFPEIAQAADLAAVAAKILEVLAEPMHLAGSVLRLTASIGIAVYPDDGAEPQVLLGHADAAMYRSKKRGRGNFEFHAVAPEAESPAPEPAPAAPLARRSDAFAEHEAHLRALRGANRQLLEAARDDQKMRARAELAHTRQIDFVAMAAHAMRTPLATLKLTLAAMRRGAPRSALDTTRLATLDQQGAHLARLIEDLLDGSRVGGGEFKLDRKALPVDTVLDAAVEASRPVFAPKAQTLQLSRSSTSVAVLGDSMRLTQLFVNLLTNASRRAAEAGSIRFSVEVRGMQAVFTVTDDGAAIEAEMLDRVFELYNQDKSLPSNEAGLGIGLAVAQEIARAHGGSLVAGNVCGARGAEFVATLPCAAPSAPGHAPQ